MSKNQTSLHHWRVLMHRTPSAPALQILQCGMPPIALKRYPFHQSAVRFDRTKMPNSFASREANPGNVRGRKSEVALSKIDRSFIYPKSLGHVSDRPVQPRGWIHLLLEWHRPAHPATCGLPRLSSVSRSWSWKNSGQDSDRRWRGRSGRRNLQIKR